MTSLSQRQHISVLIQKAVDDGACQAKACEIVGLSVRTLQRWKQDPACADRRLQRQQPPHNRLSDLERQEILALLNSPTYADLPPSQIVPRLADQGRYVASESTMYRVLRQAGQLTHRGADKPRQQRSRPTPLSATAPNQIYSWDITYLPAPIKGQFYYLYLFMDIFSRKIVGWQVFETEDSERAAELVRDIYRREQVRPGQVVLHSDNGSPMRSALLQNTLHQLGVRPSFSRPSVSNDNPFSESLFRTLKYRPLYPRKPFASLHQARCWVDGFGHWYNTEHRHSAICYVTPDERHHHLDQALLVQRHAVYEAARAKNPQRWSGKTRNWSRIEVVHLNPENHQNRACSNRENLLKLAA